MNNPTAIPLTPSAQPIFQRFLWKEYRMLRGFWLAVGVLAVIVQYVLPHLQYDARSVPVQLFATAWGAAALYAVGAAITLFSAEQEERTHDFLRVLPDRWLPMFAGKVLLALLSAAALAIFLSLTGWLLANNSWPAEAAIHKTLAILGVAIIEATAWGLLFSLWMKQPLLAAIVSMAAASIGAQLAVIATTPNDPTAYSEAVIARFLLCLGIFLVDLWLASRWLNPHSISTSIPTSIPAPAGRRGFAKRLLKQHRAATLESISTQQTQAATTVSPLKKHPLRRRMMTSLLWQTWRESWKTMLAAVPIGLLLMTAISATSWLTKSEAITAFLCPLLIPALFGALVFRADQRPGHRQFLVAHAGRPRYVWLARQLVWLSALVVLGTVTFLMAMLLAAWGLWEQTLDYIRYQQYADGYHQTAWSITTQVQDALSTCWSFASVGGYAVFAAYGSGQLCSMLLKREVLAGFLALLLAAVLTAWTIVVGLWQLNPVWFVLPIGVVALAATWLRAPDWIVGRNGPRTWLAPALSIVLPLGLIFSTLPQARLDQVALAPTSQLHKHLQAPLEDSLREFKASQAEARETATAYEQLVAELGNAPENDASRGKILKRLEELSLRSASNFPLDVALNGIRYWPGLNELKHLLLQDAALLEQQSRLQEAFEKYLTLIRLDGQILYHQRTNICEHAYARQSGGVILDWAQLPDQTSQNLKTAIRDLQTVYANYPQLREAVLADHLLIRDVLLEKEPASFFSNEHKVWSDYLPYMANKLSWERERALRALDILTELRLNAMDKVTSLLESNEDRRITGRWQFSFAQNYQAILDRYDTETIIESVYAGDWDIYHAAQRHNSLCRTSFLVRDEMYRRVNTQRFLGAAIDAEIAHRGLLLQLALIAYRLDHDEYPASLGDLSPEYIFAVPLDPYSQEPFEYRAAGLDLPLKPSDYNRYAEIAPNTPLLWSVGGGINELVPRFIVDATDEDDEDNDEAERPKRQIYRFRPTGPYWGSGGRSLAFPLPVNQLQTHKPSEESD